ncbi:MAG: hypothetical protein NC180_04685 [Muribaculaceae bacterium]|nr:hypothetical protein [Roseburia sp.]MCM1430298.1 hypothetical protein [Muribaculaceae bacterium]MCM1492506.1 hypothetical protein [Muribaculaceae bacterium]
MKRGYNSAISQRANYRLKKRARALQVQKQMLALAVLIFVCLTILLGGSIRTLANSGRGETLHKYYTSIRLEKGDTLWDLADTYTVDDVMDRETFIREVSELNGLSDGQIHRDAYIVVPYYSAEEK